MGPCSLHVIPNLLRWRAKIGREPQEADGDTTSSCFVPTSADRSCAVATARFYVASARCCAAAARLCAAPTRCCVVAARCWPAPTTNALCSMAARIPVWDPESSILFCKSTVIISDFTLQFSPIHLKASSLARQHVCGWFISVTIFRCGVFIV
jgi:hypothetical protein